MKNIALAPLVLCACSQVDDSRIFTGARTVSTNGGYETLSSKAASTSDLGGVTLQTRNGATNPVLRRNSGSLTHNTGETVIRDGTYELVDGDGIQNGLITDGISVMTVTAAQGFSTNYDFVRAYNHGYVAGGTPYSTEGVVGIVTRTADMPSAGSASWTGEAKARFTTSTGAIDLTRGTSNLTANFATKEMSATLNGFRATLGGTNSPATVPFDTIAVGGMAIRGNVFSGGTVRTTKSGTAVDVTGTRSEESVAGNFYGGSSAGIPDEVGGAINVVGANGSLSAIFIAD